MNRNEHMRDARESAELDAEELFMTAGERLVRQGFERGQRRGQTLAKRDDLLWLLDRRFGPLAADVIARVDAACLPELEHWFRRVLDAASLEEVLASEHGSSTSRPLPDD
jgi:hypothetical protein